MIPSSLISDLRTLFSEKPEEEVHFYVRGICRLLADVADDATFGNGIYLAEPTKVKLWLRAVANAARMTRVQQYENRIPCGRCGHVHLGSCSICNDCPQIEPPAPIVESEVAGSRSLIAVNADSGRPPQPHATCPHCPHAVHGSEPCPETMGAGRGCGCQGSEGA